MNHDCISYLKIFFLYDPPSFFKIFPINEEICFPLFGNTSLKTRAQTISIFLVMLNKRFIQATFTQKNLSMITPVPQQVLQDLRRILPRQLSICCLYKLLCNAQLFLGSIRTVCNPQENLQILEQETNHLPEAAEDFLLGLLIFSHETNCQKVPIR